jgi:predicted PurR-regulated permease PerM
MAAPFIAPITWALALSVAAQPIYEWVQDRIGRPNLAAGVSTTLVTLGMLLPAILLGQQIGRETLEGGEQLRDALKSGQLEGQLQSSPALAELYRLVAQNLNFSQALEQAFNAVQARIGGWVEGTFWLGAEILITIFLLFYIFRDRRQALGALYWLLPMSRPEANKVVQRVRSMIRATIYGTLVVAALQGALGGFMFWILGVPGALLWGTAMGLLAIIPVLGAFVIWIPVAAMLALQGSWSKAAILTAWGAVVIGMLDNVLYPILVGKEIRIHTVPVFLAILGGLVIFGTAGLVLGPVALVITLALIEVVKQRLNGRAEAAHESV